MDAAWAVLEKLEGVDNGVNAAYYGLAAEYYQVCGPLSFPRPTLTMLAAQRRIRAILQELAALPCLRRHRQGHVVGGASAAGVPPGAVALPRRHDLQLWRSCEGNVQARDVVYSRLTQLMHPILGSLDGTPHEWIKKLLFTFNEGNIGKFEALAPLFPKEVRS